jgi:hypothetical protein
MNKHTQKIRKGEKAMIDTTRNQFAVDLVISREKLRFYLFKQQINFCRFAVLLGMSESHFHKFMRTGVGGGRILWSKLYYYCKVNKLNFDDFLEG